MRGVLIQPPFSDPSMPVLGLAYLSNALTRASIEHLVVDANLDYWQSRILTEEIYPWPQKKGVLAEDLYVTTTKALYKSLKNMERTFPGYNFSLNGCKIPGGWHNLNNVKEISQDPSNPFFSWSNLSSIFEKIGLFQPDWIGISVTFEDQLLPAMCIAHRLKKEDQNLSIILGGAFFTTFQDYIDERTPLWNIIDGIVVGPGGEALNTLKKVNGKWVPDKNVHFFSPQGWVADFLKESSNQEEYPDFNHFPLKQYWTPGIILPYRVLPRCSWNRCTFCADARYSKGTKQSSSSVGERIEAMYSIANHYKAQGIYFVDAELTEDTMELLISNSNDTSLVWGGNARFSSFLIRPDTAYNLYRGGCRLLRLGLESASPRVLDRMNKGINIDIVSQVIKNLGESGIAVHVYLMKGFPTETHNDWMQTVNFIKLHAKWIDMISVSGFTLYEKSSIWRELLDNNKVKSKVLSDYWAYPEVQSVEQFELNADEIDGMINMILDERDGSRNCLTTAHTLILSDKFSRGLYSR